MKITVIATGFERETAASLSPAEVARSLHQRQGPSFLGAANAPEAVPVNPARPHPDLDVPTFIRKKAD